MSNSCSHDHKNYFIKWNQTVYKIIKYKTNYLYFIGDYTVINWVIEACNNRWSDIVDGLHATLFPVKRDKPICSPDLIFKRHSVLP